MKSNYRTLYKTFTKEQLECEMVKQSELAFNTDIDWGKVQTTHPRHKVSYLKELLNK